MRILVSNDDGVNAPGLYELAKAMQALGDVTVVAPDQQRSASSHGISLHSALYADAVDIGLPGVTAWSISGTPVDCVKWGAMMFGQREPFDLMVAGINEGANLATDVLYSGTVAAAGEGALQGIPAVAFSIVGPPFPYADAAQVALHIITTLHLSDLPADTFLNVNFPPSEILTASWHLTEIGARTYRNEFIHVTDEAGRTCYRHAGEELEETRGPDADVRALRLGEISITPLTYRFTNHAMLDSLKSGTRSAQNRLNG